MATSSGDQPPPTTRKVTLSLSPPNQEPGMGHVASIGRAVLAWPCSPRSGSIPAVTNGLDLTGRVAVVTGAGSPTGIGLAVCRRLGELGAAVALTATTDRVEERVHDLQEAGVQAMGVVADLSEPAAADDVV